VSRPQIFISHSKEDEDKIDFIRRMLQDTEVKPVFMEFEHWSRNKKPNWLWIKYEILKSKALMLVLTKRITEKIQTQNWVSFEVGIAASSNPPLPVFVLREEDVIFPVPYLTWYSDQPLTSLKYLEPKDFSEALLNFLYYGVRLTNLAVRIGTAIYCPQSINGYILPLKCNKCHLQFNYSGEMEKFRCPCCNNWIKNTLDK
jgi:hypothetical protein